MTSFQAASHLNSNPSSADKTISDLALEISQFSAPEFDAQLMHLAENEAYLLASLYVQWLSLHLMVNCFVRGLMISGTGEIALQVESVADKGAVNSC